MKKRMQLFLMLLAVFIFPNVYAAVLSPIGYWKTIDDVTGKPKSILYIYQTGNALNGQVVKIFPRPGYDQNEVCTACKGARHNQRIVGMIVMEGLTQDANNPMEWGGGQILDPLNGKTYNCKVTLVDNGKHLNVRGFIGISLFGRTQTWERASS